MQLIEGTGGIIAMCPCEAFLELYKEDTTFRFETPDTVDPQRTNPNAPFVAAVADRVGTSNPIIARVLLQGRDIVEAALFVRPVDTAAVVRTLHGVKEALVACHKAAEVVRTQVAEIETLVNDGKVVGGVQAARVLPSLPQVADLDLLATQFLISAKRAIKGICNLVPLFLDVERADGNFDHLGNRLERLSGGDAPLTVFVRQYADVSRYLIELRNGQEHPNPGQQTRIDNVRVLPDGSIGAPMWHVTGASPRPIHADMIGAIDRMIEMAELMLIYLVDEQLDSRWPFVINQLDDATVDPKMPVKYRLTVDVSRLTLPFKEAGDAP